MRGDKYTGTYGIPGVKGKYKEGERVKVIVGNKLRLGTSGIVVGYVKYPASNAYFVLFDDGKVTGVQSHYIKSLGIIEPPEKWESYAVPINNEPLLIRKGENAEVENEIVEYLQSTFGLEPEYSRDSKILQYNQIVSNKITAFIRLKYPPYGISLSAHVYEREHVTHNRKGVTYIETRYSCVIPELKGHEIVTASYSKPEKILAALKRNTCLKEWFTFMNQYPNYIDSLWAVKHIDVISPEIAEGIKAIHAILSPYGTPTVEQFVYSFETSDEIRSQAQVYLMDFSKLSAVLSAMNPQAPRSSDYQFMYTGGMTVFITPNSRVYGCDPTKLEECKTIVDNDQRMQQYINIVKKIGDDDLIDILSI